MLPSNVVGILQNVIPFGRHVLFGINAFAVCELARVGGMQQQAAFIGLALVLALPDREIGRKKGEGSKQSCSELSIAVPRR